MYTDYIWHHASLLTLCSGIAELCKCRVEQPVDVSANPMSEPLWRRTCIVFEMASLPSRHESLAPVLPSAIDLAMRDYSEPETSYRVGDLRNGGEVEDTSKQEYEAGNSEINPLDVLQGSPIIANILEKGI